jgi:hypothetical protein
MNNERIVIGGGPRTGKSWLARQLATETGAPRFCGDPLSVVKEPFGGVTYLPEGIPFSGDSGAAQWICDHWFGDMEGPWICEGHVMVRALRRWMVMAENDGQAEMDSFPCDRIIVFQEQRPEIELKRGQVSMHKAVMTVWREIEDYYQGIIELR